MHHSSADVIGYNRLHILEPDKKQGLHKGWGRCSIFERKKTEAILCKSLYLGWFPPAIFFRKSF